MGVVLSLPSALLLVSAEVASAEAGSKASTGLFDMLKANKAASACFASDCLQRHVGQS